MIKEKKNLEQISKYYIKKQPSIDKKLLSFRFKTIKKYLKGKRCLEIGSAEGLMTKYLVKNFDEVTVIEGSQILLDQIPNYRNLVKINELFEEYKPRYKYDTIILDHVLEHVKEPNIILKKINTLLSLKGVFIVGVPNADSIHRLVAVEMGILKKKNELNFRDKILGHRRVYNPSTLKKVLNKNKFKIKNFEGILFKPFSNNQIEKFLNKNAINGFYKLSKKFPYNCADICYICTK